MPQPFKFSPLTLGILKYLLRTGIKHFNGRAKNVVFHAGFIYKAIYNYTLPCRSNILIYLCILFPAVFMSTSACKTDYRNSKQARIVFNETLHDFGIIALNPKIHHNYIYINSGESGQNNMPVILFPTGFTRFTCWPGCTRNRTSLKKPFK